MQRRLPVRLRCPPTPRGGTWPSGPRGQTAASEAAAADGPPRPQPVPLLLHRPQPPGPQPLPSAPCFPARGWESQLPGLACSCGADVHARAVLHAPPGWQAMPMVATAKQVQHKSSPNDCNGKSFHNSATPNPCTTNPIDIHAITIPIALPMRELVGRGPPMSSIALQQTDKTTSCHMSILTRARTVCWNRD